MSNERFAVSKEPGGAHHRLSLLVGRWRGMIKTWFEPEKLSDQSPISGTMRSVLDGRFILHEYETAFGGKPIQGMAIYGFHLDRQRFESVWIDSFGMGTGIMFSESENKPSRLSFTGSYGQGADRSGWRTEIEVAGPDQVLVTSYDIAPRGLLAKASEITYARVVEASNAA